MTMDVKAAVDHAKIQIQTLFGDEGIKNLGLEEVVHDDAKSVWRVTIGFSRPWDEPPSRNAFAALAGETSRWHRAYKVVRIADATAEVLSVRSLVEKV